MSVAESNLPPGFDKERFTDTYSRAWQEFTFARHILRKWDRVQIVEWLKKTQQKAPEHAERIRNYLNEHQLAGVRRTNREHRAQR